MTAFDSADGLALRRAVCAAPDDDLPRLVLADYLDESGDAGDADRAAFIRAQCEMEGVPWMSQRWRKLNSSAATLLEKHREVWPTTVARLGVMSPHWGRGFIESVQVFAKTFTAKSGRKLLDVEPVREVRLVHLAKPGGLGVAEFVADPVVGRLRGLDFGSTGFAYRDIEAVAAAGQATLAGLEALRLNQMTRDDLVRGLPLLLRSLPRLSTLGTSASGYGDDRSLAQAVTEVSQDPVFARLAHLDIIRAGVARAAIALARSPHLGGLKRLRLSYGEVTRAGVAALAGAALTALEILDLSDNRTLTEAHVRSPAGAAFVPTLKVLVVRRCGLAKANGQRFAGLFPHAEVVV